MSVEEQVASQQELKMCPSCGQPQPVSEFGICRARKDGRNLYCKHCICKKIKASRQAARELRCKASLAVAKSRQKVKPRTRKMTPIQKVREAIRVGMRTQRQIAQETGLSRDEICDALANLLVWTREIGTEVRADTRIYFIREVERPVIDCEGDFETSFSSLNIAMPGRHQNGAPHRNRGWNAS
jgi:hypothetical protein